MLQRNALFPAHKPCPCFTLQPINCPTPWVISQQPSESVGPHDDFSFYWATAKHTGLFTDCVFACRQSIETSVWGSRPPQPSACQVIFSVCYWPIGGKTFPPVLWSVNNRTCWGEKPRSAWNVGPILQTLDNPQSRAVSFNSGEHSAENTWCTDWGDSLLMWHTEGCMSAHSSEVSLQRSMT